MKKYVVLTLIVFMNMVAIGAPLKLDLEESIRLAYENSYILKNADIDLTNSNLQVKEAYKEALPKLDYIGRADRSGEEMYGDNKDSKTNYDHSLEVVQPLFRGGTIKAGVDAAKSINEISLYEYDNTKNDLRLDVIEKYITILQLIESQEVFEESLKEVEEQYNKANRKYELKLIAKSEVLPFKTRVINNRTSIIETVNKIKIAEVELKNELGISRDIEIELTPIAQEKYDLDLIDLDADVKFARVNNKDAKIANLNIEIAKAEESLAKSEFLPQVDLRAGYGSDDSKFNDSADSWEWNAGVTVSMNLFSFGQDMNAYDRAKNNTEKTRNSELRAQDDIEVEVRTYYLGLISLGGTVDEQEAAVESALENLNLERRRYESGLTDVIDFLQIENSLRESELALIEAQLNYYLAYEKYKDSLR